MYKKLISVDSTYFKYYWQIQVYAKQKYEISRVTRVCSIIRVLPQYIVPYIFFFYKSVSST